MWVVSNTEICVFLKVLMKELSQKEGFSYLQSKNAGKWISCSSRLAIATAKTCPQMKNAWHDSTQVLTKMFSNKQTRSLSNQTLFFRWVFLILKHIWFMFILPRKELKEKENKLINLKYSMLNEPHFIKHFQDLKSRPFTYFLLVQ